MKIKTIYLWFSLSISLLNLAKGQGENNNHKNPIIRGFNPDPSIIRVEEDYYIATSTFEWFPGIALYHSKDLVNWRQIGHALNEKQIDLSGYPNSGGVYAPSLHHHDDWYYLTYSTVQGDESAWPMTPMPTYVIKTKDIFGDWSKPIYLSSVGFDPSLVFDKGKTYLLNMVQDFRWSEPTMGKIVIQEFDLDTGQPKGDLKVIAEFDNVNGTEGPHIYYRNGFYYLMVAQGGTFYNHMVTISRSKHLLGPYELPEDWPLLTSANDSTLNLQRAGHGCLVETQNGEWFLTYLASRSLMPGKRSPLGRESCLQQVRWTADDWLELVGDQKKPQEVFSAPDLPGYSFVSLPVRDEFITPLLRVDYQTLRQKHDSTWLRFKHGKLLMKGRRVPTSEFDVSLLARRLTSYQMKVETELSFEPKIYRHKSGLSAFYDSKHFYLSAISYDDSLGVCAELLGFQRGKYTEFGKLKLDNGQNVKIKFEVQGDSISFYVAEKEKHWKQLSRSLYFGDLSDEQEDGSGFTGTMAALITIDALNESLWAEFEYFEVVSNDDKE